MITSTDILKAANLARTVAEIFNESALGQAASTVGAYASLLADIINVIETKALDRDVLENLIKDAMTKASDAEVKRELGL